MWFRMSLRLRGKNCFIYCPLLWKSLPCSLQAISYSYLILAHVIEETMNPFFFSPWRALRVTSRNAKGLVTHPAKQDIQNWPPGFTGSVILLSFLFLLFWQVPTASVTIEGASALNRVRWAQAGKEVAVGDSEGRIWIYDVGEVLLLFEGFFKKSSAPEECYIQVW